MSASYHSVLTVPSAVSALSFASSDSLCVGSDDGSLRWYTLPEPRVIRAIKSLGRDVSSIACTRAKEANQRAVWVASGQRAYLFPVEMPKMISTPEDATVTLDIGADEEDVLNELSLSENGKHLAYSSDSGGVGVVDLSLTSYRISRTKASHSNVCGAIKFVPDRPSEIVSGGYDSTLLHFDFQQGTILSRYDISAPPPTSSGISLSPPFVLSVALNSSALLAASTADGRVWLGGGGEKVATSKKKRTRKWEGLREEDGLWLQIADGPVVAVTFPKPDRLLACSLLGNLCECRIARDEEGRLHAEQTWSASAHAIEKVNAIAVSEKWLALGGFVVDGKKAKGVVEIWSWSAEEPTSTLGE